jgi:hypothetical protein
LDLGPIRDTTAVRTGDHRLLEGQENGMLTHLILLHPTSLSRRPLDFGPMAHRAVLSELFLHSGLARFGHGHGLVSRRSIGEFAR